jgi:hypothetical protein
MNNPVYPRRVQQIPENVSSLWSRKSSTSPPGVRLRKKPKDLSTSERDERGYGKGVGEYPTLLQSDTVHPYGPVGVGLFKKPKDLSVSESEESSVDT